MKTITIRELHYRTGELVREASRHGEIRITDTAGWWPGYCLKRATGGPYFGRRKPSAAFKRLDNSGKTGQGADSTITISEDREDRA